MFRDGFFIFGSRMAASAATMLVGVILARQFGPDAQGQYAVMFASVLFLQLFADLGLSYANVLHIGQGAVDQTAIVAVTLYVGGGIAILLTVSAVAALPLLQSTIFGGAPNAIMAIGLCSLPAIVVGSALNSVNLGRQHLFRFNVINFVQGMLNLALVVLVVFAFGWGMRAVAAAWLIASLVYVSASGFCALQGIDRRRALDPRVARAAARIVLAPGARSQAGNIAQFMNNRFDQLLVSAWLGPAKLGYYVAAVSIGEAFRFLPNAVNTLLLSRVAAANDRDSRAMTARAFKFTAAFACIWAAGMLIAGGWLIKLLYGSTYGPAVLPARILIPGVALLMTSAVFGAYLAGRGKAMINSWITFAGLAVTIALDLVLIPVWGITGAAVASLASYSTCAALTMAVYWRSESTAPRPNRHVFEAQAGS